MTSHIREEQATKVAERELTRDTLCDIAALATKISSGKPMSVEDLQREVTAIADEHYETVANVKVLLQKHVKQRQKNAHPGGSSAAYVSLMSPSTK